MWFSPCGQYTGSQTLGAAAMWVVSKMLYLRRLYQCCIPPSIIIQPPTMWYDCHRAFNSHWCLLHWHQTIQPPPMHHHHHHHHHQVAQPWDHWHCLINVEVPRNSQWRLVARRKCSFAFNMLLWKMNSCDKESQPGHHGERPQKAFFIHPAFSQSPPHPLLPLLERSNMSGRVLLLDHSSAMAHPHM